MVSKGLTATIGALVLALLSVTPVVATAQPGGAAAEATALSVRVSPSALLVLDTSTLHGLLPQVPNIPLTGQVLSQVDYTQSLGTLAPGARAFATSGSVNEPVYVDVQALDAALAGLAADLKAYPQLNPVFDKVKGPARDAIDRYLGHVLAGYFDQLSSSGSVGSPLEVRFPGSPTRIGPADLVRIDTPLIGTTGVAPYELSAGAPEASASNATSALSVGSRLPGVGAAELASVLASLRSLAATLDSAISSTPGGGLLGTVGGLLPPGLTLPQAAALLADVQKLVSALDAFGTPSLSDLVATNGNTSVTSVVARSGGGAASAATKLVNVDVLSIRNTAVLGALQTALGAAGYRTKLQAGVPLLKVEGASAAASALATGAKLANSKDMPVSSNSLTRVTILGTIVINAGDLASRVCAGALAPGTSCSISVGPLTVNLTRGATGPGTYSADNTAAAAGTTALEARLSWDAAKASGAPGLGSGMIAEVAVARASARSGNPRALVSGITVTPPPNTGSTLPVVAAGGTLLLMIGIGIAVRPRMFGWVRR